MWNAVQLLVGGSLTVGCLGRSARVAIAWTTAHAQISQLVFGSTAVDASLHRSPSRGVVVSQSITRSNRDRFRIYLIL